MSVNSIVKQPALHMSAWLGEMELKIASGPQRIPSQLMAQAISDCQQRETQETAASLECPCALLTLAPPAALLPPSLHPKALPPLPLSLCVVHC